MWIRLWVTRVDRISQPNLLMLWKQAIGPLRSRLGAEDFCAWIEPLTPVALREGEIEIAVPNRLFAGWIQENFLDELAAAWVAAAGKQATFRFTYRGDISAQGALFAPEQTGAVGDDQLGLFTKATAARQEQFSSARSSGGLIPR